AELISHPVVVRNEFRTRPRVSRDQRTKLRPRPVVAHLPSPPPRARAVRPGSNLTVTGRRVVHVPADRYGTTRAVGRQSQAVARGTPEVARITRTPRAQPEERSAAPPCNPPTSTPRARHPPVRRRYAALPQWLHPRSPNGSWRDRRPASRCRRSAETCT